MGLIKRAMYTLIVWLFEWVVTMPG